MLKYNERAAQLAAALEDENNFDDYGDLLDEDMRELRETLTDSDGFYYRVTYGSGVKFAKHFLDDESYEQFAAALKIVREAEDLWEAIAEEC